MSSCETSNNNNNNNNSNTNNSSSSSGTAGPGGGNSGASTPGGSSNSGAAASGNTAVTSNTSGANNNNNNSNNNIGSANNAATTMGPTGGGGGGSSGGSTASAIAATTSTVNASAATTTTGAAAAKLSHSKATTITTTTTAAAASAASAASTGAQAQHDSTTASNSGSGASSAGQQQQLGLGASTANATHVTSAPATISTAATATAIKVTSSGLNATIGTPIGISASNAPATTAAAIRAIGAGGQSTQVRVVMPTSMMGPPLIKQLESAATTGRTQITTFPAAPAPRTISNTSITVTRPVTQTTYLPRASVTATQMSGVATGQRLVTPVRAATGTIGASGATVTGLTAAGSFVRGTAVSRNTASPGTTVISPATNTTWMTANTAGQVQLIRTIPQPTRQRIITAQGITTVGAGGASGTTTAAAVSGTVVAAGNAAGAGNTPGAQSQSSGNAQQSTIQIVSSPTSVAAHVSQHQQQQQQQTYVATLSTVLPPRQHQATLVYSSNVAAASSQAQQFSPSVASTQRFAVATPLTTTTVGAAGTTRQIRPMTLGKSFSTTKLNTTSISIRAPNLPQLAPTIATSVSVGGNGLAAASGTAAAVATTGTIATIAGTGTNSPRSTSVTGPTASVIPTSNLPTTRIIQLQQPPTGATQQLISSTGRLTGNVMLQPIIVNTSAGGKIGIRPPVTMAAKVQPSLTITQLGISKLPATSSSNANNLSGGCGNNSGSVNSSAGGGGGNGSASPAISAATNLTTSGAAAAAAAAQLINAQNIVSSASTATVVPLAITTRGANGGNILTGTITPLKMANGITVGKVMAQASGAPATVVVAASSGNIIDATSTAATTTIAAAASPATSNVFISHQRPVTGTAGSNNNTNNIVSSGATTVLTSTGTPTSSGTAFLAPGTIYYESVPASSVQVSTGVLSLTTTTVTSSTMSQNQITSSSANLAAITSLPFVSHSNGTSPATFTVVPSSGGRTIGQLQLPVSTAGTQLAAVPVRFSTQLPVGSIAGSAISVNDAAIAVAQNKTHLVQGQQLIMPGNSTTTSQAQMVIPMQTSIKVTTSSSGGTGAGSSATGSCSSSGSASATPAIVPNFMRKSGPGEVGLRAAKNLGPTLLSMGSTSHSSSGAGSPVSVTSVGNCYSISSGATSGTFPLTVEALAKKERAAANAGGGCATIVSSSTRSSRVASPASSDGGSTTVSAHSSPGVDQMQDGNMLINRMSVANDSMHFNPINELYANHPSVSIQHNLPSTSGSSRNSSLDQRQQLQGSPTSQRLNGGGVGPIDCPPRKKSRRSTNDSQQSIQSQTSLNLPPPSSLTNPLGVQLDGGSSALSCVVAVPGVGGGSGMTAGGCSMTTTGVCHGGGGMVSGDLLMAATSAAAMAADTITLMGNNNHHGNITMPPAAGNKENAKPTEYILRRPRNCTLLNGYKQTGKVTNNHFQRYSDVKPRKPNPSVIDLANQPNILAKINGWKIYHLQSQMKDLCDDENTGYEKLAEMLKSMETHEQSQDMERISDLLKGNMQRSKIIVDGVNEAQNQIMKIFEHKTHVSDIINRCASKRNFKKRDKV